MAFVVDDLLAWLVGLVADAGRKKLITRVLGTDQERALRPAVEAAVAATAAQLAPSGEEAGQLAMAVGEVFCDAPKVTLAGRATLLEALQAGIAARLAVLDDPDVTGTGQSSMELLEVPGGVLAKTLAGHLVHEITVRGAQGGPLTPLADQLNQDMTHLQGQRLEGMLAQVVSLVTALARVARGPQVLRKPVRLADPPPLLAGREDLLAELDVRLSGSDGSRPRTVVLTGLGGAGKTSLALAYAQRHLGEVGVAWQFPAEDATVLAAGFGELAAQLGTGDVADSRDPVASVHGMLAKFPAGWLLLFDNVPDRASIEEFLPPAGPGRVLITSQNPNWPHGQALPVPVLDTEVAADFLVTRTSDQDQRAARELASEVDGLPLALEQAAAYILATGDTLAEYVGLFEKRRADMLSRGEAAGYRGTVATTWALAFARLEQSAPGAAGLLRLLAFCAPEAIPLRVLLQPRLGLTEQLSPQVAAVLVPLLKDELAARDAIAALRRYSLISPVVGGAVSVHRLVQAVTGDQMPADLARAWQQAAAAVIEAAIPNDPKQPETWPVFGLLLPHAEAAFPASPDGMERMASYLGFSGNYAAARDLQRRVFGVLERVLGPEHPNTLNARANLSRWTGQAGDAAGAREQCAELLPVVERVLGAEHLDTLTTLGNLAYWTGDVGDAAGARDQYAALLPLEERVLGPEDPQTLITRGNLAYWTGDVGDAAGAREQYAALLPLEERVLGLEHPQTLTTRNNLADWTGHAGDAAGARDQFAALLPMFDRVLGPEHPSTLAARANLARWAGYAGDAATAREQYAELLPVVERVLGPEHPQTLATRKNLASLARNAAEARDEYAELLPVIKRVFGAEHPDTLTTRGNLAHWTGQAGDAATARDQYAELLPVIERVFGAEHPDTLTTRGNLARWTGQVGDAAGARDQYAELLPVIERVRGPEHPDTLTARGSLARWTGLTGDAAGARDQCAELLPMRVRILGPEHLDTLIARGNLASWTGLAGDAAGARDQCAELLPVIERVRGAEDPETLIARNNLAYWSGEATGSAN